MQVSAPVAPGCDLTLPLNSSDPSSYLRQLCSDGYYGPVCSLCVKTDNKQYGRAGPLQCQECKSTAVVLVAYILSTLVVLAWLSYTVHVTLVENEEAAAGSTDPGRTSQLIRVCLHLPAHTLIHSLLWGILTDHGFGPRGWSLGPGGYPKVDEATHWLLQEHPLHMHGCQHEHTACNRQCCCRKCGVVFSARLLWHCCHDMTHEHLLSVTTMVLLPWHMQLSALSSAP